MRIIYNPKHFLHKPTYEFFNGRLEKHADSVLRAENILNTLRSRGFEPQEYSMQITEEIIEAVHTREYLDYLSELSASLSEDEEFIPSVFPGTSKLRNENFMNNLGKFSLDTYTPVLKESYNQALASASVAYEAAFRLGDENLGIVYALCRPSGHHADKSMMGGYCYLNNAAVAAELLSRKGKVAILDLDYHHGNGTQGIFYSRNDVFYLSIHRDPSDKFPYFFGYEDERGLADGLGFNRNYPLPAGVNDDEYLVVLKKALDEIRDFNPEYLVVSLGVDTYEQDPICDFKLTSGFYSVMGEEISKLSFPKVVIQEGGYDVKSIGVNVVNFLEGISG